MKTRTWVILLCAVAFACLAAIVLLPISEEVAARAELYQNGALIGTLPLDADTVFTVSTPDGNHNTVVVSNGRIRVEQATCPDQLCVKQGWSRTQGYPIVCLPHGLVIQLKGGDTPFDAATN